MTRGALPRLLFATAVFASLAGCANRRPPDLYLWEDFTRQQYELLVHEGSGPGDHLQALQAHVEKAQASHAALPPGLRAHLGMLYLNAGNVEQARSLWLAEKEAFPESAPFMDRLLKRLDAMTTPKAENPA